MVLRAQIGIIIGLLFSLLVFYPYANAQVNYPYSSGQVIFVQSPYASSLYTNYNYNPHESAPQRLPNYTTNQAVFVQQPYATTQQTVTSYPSTYLDNLPRTDNRYMTPSAYPTTVAPAYPFANVTGYVASPYPITAQSSTYTYPYRGKDSNTVYTYPYTTDARTVAYPPPVVEKVPTAYGATSTTASYLSGGLGQPAAPAYTGNAYRSYQSATYNAYPISTITQYPNPITSSAIPQTVIQPTKPPPPPASPYGSRPYP